ncbi:hypothetical protein KM043_006553 [Ampulex compressa]|nr:hypothetical protein KM043_006553 [Ampulex compressa]
MVGLASQVATPHQPLRDQYLNLEDVGKADLKLSWPPRPISTLQASISKPPLAAENPRRARSIVEDFKMRDSRRQNLYFFGERTAENLQRVAIIIATSQQDGGPSVG